MTKPRGLYPVLALSTVCLVVASIFFVLDDNVGAAVSVMASCLLSMTASTLQLRRRRTKP